ncbi:MAG: STAS-like domain-containing protein [Micrococcales bacterium]
MAALVRIGDVAESLGLPIHTIRRLADAGKIPCETSESGHRLFSLEDVKEAMSIGGKDAFAKFSQDVFHPQNLKFESSFDIPGLQEDLILRQLDDAISLALPVKCRKIFSYAFTEMLNNANDHSHGSAAVVRLYLDEASVAFEITDDGIGAFQSVASAFGLSRSVEAIGELSKGKRTADPVRHSGEGIFFTSKMADEFRLSANGLQWIVKRDIDDFSVRSHPGSKGTTVSVVISLETKLEAKFVFDFFTDDETQQFSKTAPVVKLFEIGTEFVSRSEAKRLSAGLANFSEVNLDFRKVDAVGQGFVDELFRVWQLQHPEVVINCINMNPEVEFMVNRGRGLRS